MPEAESDGLAPSIAGSSLQGPAGCVAPGNGMAFAEPQPWAHVHEASSASSSRS